MFFHLSGHILFNLYVCVDLYTLCQMTTYVLSLHYVASGDPIQITRLGDRHHYPLYHTVSHIIKMDTYVHSEISISLKK